MGKDYGKKFEEKFKRDFIKTFPGGCVVRLYDQMSGKYGSKNICDFIGYNSPYFFIIECKTHAGASLPIANITQYYSMMPYVNKTGIRVGVVLWLYEKEKVYYVPISTVMKMKADGKKSVGIKSVDEGYRIIEIPGNVLRTFIDSDYSCLMDLHEGD